MVYAVVGCVGGKKGGVDLSRVEVEIKVAGEEISQEAPASSSRQPFLDGSFSNSKGLELTTVSGRRTGSTRRSTIGGWTDEEDQLLKQLVKEYNEKNWKKIAEFLPGRKDVQCLHRWQKVLNPNLIKGTWSKEEDDLLLELVAKHGTKKWSLIAKSLAGRIGKQCRERWHNHLNPAIKKDSWTAEEEMTLINAHQKYGNRWSEIAKVLPGRTDNTIKNHWNCSVKKRLVSGKLNAESFRKTECTLSVHSINAGTLNVDGNEAAKNLVFSKRNEMSDVNGTSPKSVAHSDTTTSIRHPLSNPVASEDSMHSESDLESPLNEGLKCSTFSENCRIESPDCGKNDVAPKFSQTNITSTRQGSVTDCSHSNYVNGGCEFSQNQHSVEVNVSDYSREAGVIQSELSACTDNAMQLPLLDSCKARNTTTEKISASPKQSLGNSSTKRSSNISDIQSKYEVVCSDFPNYLFLNQSPETPRYHVIESFGTCLLSLSGMEGSVKKPKFSNCRTPPDLTLSLSSSSSSADSRVMIKAKGFNTPIIRKRQHCSFKSSLTENPSMSSLGAKDAGVICENIDTTLKLGFCQSGDRYDQAGVRSTDVVNFKKMFISSEVSLKNISFSATKSLERRRLEYDFDKERPDSKADITN